jgi:hypothetical protein
MAVLSDESDRAVVKHGHDHGAAWMMDHFALVRQFTFSNGIDGDIEYTTLEHFLTVQYFWQLTHIVS